MNGGVAVIYRTYVTYDRPLKIASPRNTSTRDVVLDAGSGVILVVDGSRFAGWRRLELYDGARKVDEPAEFAVKGLTAGYHAFSVLGTDGRGNVRPSGPVPVVVREPAATSRP